MPRALFPLLLLLLFATPLAAQDDQPWLGAKLAVLDAAEAKKLGVSGLRVERVDAGGPAAQAGLEVGDVVLSAGEATITTIEGFREVLGKKRPGDMLSLGVRKASGGNEPLLVTLGSTADKNDKFADDAKVKELRERLRELDAERRKAREELDRRLEELRTGKANKETQPAPGPRVEEPAKPEPSRTVEPERVQLKVSMGAAFESLTPEEARKLGVESGIRAQKVTQGGAAAEAGLKEGDIVTRAGGEAVTGTGHLRTLLSRLNPGDKLELELLRGGKKQSLTIVLRPRE